MILNILKEEIGIGRSFSAFIKYQMNQIRKGGIIVFTKKTKSFFKIVLLVSQILFLSIVSLPIILLIRIIRPFVLVRFGKLTNSRIGHYAGNTELYLCKRDAGLHPRKAFDIFYNDDRKVFCNQQLKKMWERTQTLRIWKFSRYLYHANKLLPGYKKHVIPTSDRDIHNLLERIPAHLSFTVEEEKKGYEELRKIGIPDNAKFVCFIVRESSYLNTIFSKGDWRYHNYRDSDIHKYIPAIEGLVKRGYFGLRMGAVVKESLNISNPKIIDYAVNYRTDFMDIYLCAKCQFFLNSGTGMESIPIIFRRPVVRVNTIPIEYLPTWGKDLFIPKKLWLVKEHRCMTFREIFESGVGRFVFTEQYIQSYIEIIDNTPEEIKAVVIEMDERLKGTWQTTEKDEELQKRFWALFKKCELHGVIKARIGTDFLRQNKDLLE